jgi:LCP family protein required for cell wall assembly
MELFAAEGSFNQVKPMKQSLLAFVRGFIRTFLISLFIGTVIVVWAITWIIPQVLGRLNQVQTVFADEAGRSAWSIGIELLVGYKMPVFQEKQRWLLLGVDEVTGSGREDILTDTIILATYDPAVNALRLLSFPRDIYLIEERSRINGLYQIALESGSSQPEKDVETTFSDLIQQPINETIVVSLDELAEIIDIMGGLPIEVQNSFTDPSFPRSGVDVTIERDPAVLYESLHFEAGPQVLDGETALKFIRSRKALEPEEAGDEARARRQRQVTEAMVQRMQSTEILANPGILGRLYDWYSRNLMMKVPLTTLGQLGKTVLNHTQPLQMESVSLPVTELSVSTDSATLFVHPPERLYGGAWVYTPVDPTWEQLRAFIVENGL